MQSPADGKPRSALFQMCIDLTQAEIDRQRNVDGMVVLPRTDADVPVAMRDTLFGLPRVGWYHAGWAGQWHASQRKVCGGQADQAVEVVVRPKVDDDARTEMLQEAAILINHLTGGELKRTRTKHERELLDAIWRATR